MQAIKVDTSKLDRLIARAPGVGEKLLDEAAHRIEVRAKDSMKGGGVPHVPSAPGEPPHVDTGALQSSIHVETPGPFTRLVGDGVEYGVYLEFGTKHMAARPWLLPAVETEREPFLASWKALIESI